MRPIGLEALWRLWPWQLLYRREGPLSAGLRQSDSCLLGGLLPTAAHPETTTTSVCGFCSTGCGLSAHLQAGHALRLTPDPHYPVNSGRACPKGWEALAVLDSPQRALAPELRWPGKRPQKISWEAAAAHFVSRVRGLIQQHGPGSMAFLSTGQIPTEEMAFLGYFAKFTLGILHGDGNTRQCMASAVAAYKQAFGFDAPPYTYRDLEECDVIVLVGSNLCVAHPILWERVQRNRHGPRIVVIDPRFTETAAQATHHYALRPKSDLFLFYGLAREMIARGRVDEHFIAAHTHGFADFCNFLENFTWERVSRATGLSEAALTELSGILAAGQRVSFWWTMGINQGHQAVRSAQSIINLSLMLGQIGRPGTGPHSITGQCNAMGSRLFSNTTNLLGGHDFASASDRLKVSATLGIDPERIPQANGYAYDQILSAIDRGEIRGLWIVATNTAHSWIEQGRVRKLLAKLDFLVVQDMYRDTETAAFAELLLPAAGWGEKEGTFINSERRIGRVKKLRRPPGEAMSDLAIFRLLAGTWGDHDLLRRWSSPEAIFCDLARLSAGQPCDFSGLRSYSQLEACGGVQWPCPSEAQPLELPRERRLFADGRFFHPDGRARFIWEEPELPPEPSDADYPFILLTGRGSSTEWHTETRTRRSSILAKMNPAQLVVSLAASDGDALALREGDRVAVISRRARIEALAHLTHNLQSGQVFLPMHKAATNLLTQEVVDPISRQPHYKHCAVRIEKISASLL